MFNQYSGYDKTDWLNQLKKLYLRLKDIQPALVVDAGQVLLKHLFMTQPIFAQLIAHIGTRNIDFINLIEKCKENVSQQRTMNAIHQHKHIAHVTQKQQS